MVVQHVLFPGTRCLGPCTHSFVNTVAARARMYYRALYSSLPHAHCEHFLFTESVCQLPTGFFYAGKRMGRGNVVGLPIADDI
jgi:hypothetical protein